MAGFVIGGYTGAVVGAVAALSFCKDSHPWSRCVSRGLAIGGFVGTVGGAVMGAVSNDRITGAWIGAAVGFTGGAVVGLAWKGRWDDGGVLGGAIGSIVGAILYRGSDDSLPGVTPRILLPLSVTF